MNEVFKKKNLDEIEELQLKAIDWLSRYAGFEGELISSWSLVFD
jgi:hypothetical protein